MAINPIAMNAYRTALTQAPGMSQGQAITSKVSDSLGSGKAQGSGFSDIMKKTLSDVNAQQTKKDAMVESFASGENQNVHELMIQLQKAGLAMSMTTTVRSKVLDMYKELVRMSF